MYITTDKLAQAFSQNILIQLSNDDARAMAVNEAVLVSAITVATERIDASLRGRYRLPLESVPQMIEHHALYLARHWLYARRPEAKMPDTVIKTYEQSIKELEQIANGRLHLGLVGVDEGKHGDLLPDSGEFRVKASSRMDLEAY